MRSLSKQFLLLVILVAGLIHGQTALVTRNTNLRSDPSTGSAPIAKLAPQSKVALLEPDATGGYYHVQTESDDEGWVWGRNLRIEAASVVTAGSGTGTPTEPAPHPAPTPAPTEEVVATTISPDWEKPAPQSSILHAQQEGDCGKTGDGGDTATNLRKNRDDVAPSYHQVTWEAINNLPYPHGAPRSRLQWSSSELEQLAAVEGAAISVEGFLFKIKVESASLSAHSGGETTNCHFRLAPDVDWHMPLTAQVGDGESAAIVVETTPRLRQQHPNWTPQRLHPWTGPAAEKVRISGWLMLDPEHQDMITHGQRSTLWEIHPVTRIEVLQNNEWIDLDDLP